MRSLGDCDDMGRCSLDEDNNRDVRSDSAAARAKRRGPEADGGEELVVRADGRISIVADADRIEDLQRQLARRDKEIRQAAEYGIGLLEANEELQLQVAALKIRLETETDELTAERDVERRRGEHVQLELDQWRRRATRTEEDKAALTDALERAEAQAAAAVLNANRPHATRLEVTELEAKLAELEATVSARDARIASLEEWKAAAERQHREAVVSEELAARSTLNTVQRLEQEQATLRREKTVAETETKRERERMAELDTALKDLQVETRKLEDELAELRVEYSSLHEARLTADAKCCRLQRELSLLEHVSYFSEAVMDVDTDNDDDDEDDADEKSSATTLDADLGAEKLDGDSSRGRGSTMTMPATYSAFPTSSVASDGRRVALTEADVETHTKLHHYFHLTAQSIIHENQLHERCFSTSSRYQIDMWYREITKKDIPFLEWHSWLINRISEVAAAVDNEDDSKDRLPSPILASAFRGFSHRSSRSVAETSTNHLLSPVAASSASSSPVASVRVSFAAARAFFRLLWKSAGTHSLPPASHSSPSAPACA